MRYVISKISDLIGLGFYISSLLGIPSPGDVPENEGCLDTIE